MKHFIKTNLIKILFIGLLLPYLTGYIFITKHLPKIEKINEKAISYTNKADKAYKAYGVYENFDQVIKEKENQINSSVKKTKKDTKQIIKKEINKENAVSIFSSLLNDETPKEFKNIEDSVKSKAKTNFKLDLDINDEIKKQKSHPTINKIKNKLDNNELIDYIKAVIMIPVFSVISILILIISNLLSIATKKALTEKENVLLSNITYFWITTLSISLIGILIYPINKQFGFYVFILANIFYIYNCFKGIFGFKLKKCPACRQELSN